MPVSEPEQDGPGNTDVSYPLDLMNEVGLSLVQQAIQNVSTHQSLWNALR